MSDHRKRRRLLILATALSLTAVVVTGAGYVLNDEMKVAGVFTIMVAILPWMLLARPRSFDAALDAGLRLQCPDGATIRGFERGRQALLTVTQQGVVITSASRARAIGWDEVRRIRGRGGGLQPNIVIRTAGLLSIEFIPDAPWRVVREALAAAPSDLVSVASGQFVTWLYLIAFGCAGAVAAAIVVVPLVQLATGR